MASGGIRKVWEAGIPLSDAWLQFAAGAAREEYARKPGFSGTVQQLVDIVGSTRDGKLILSALQMVGSAHLDQLESTRLLQGALLDVLASEGLWATGLARRGKDASPVPIDPALLTEAVLDWDNSTLRINGALYEQVRVTDPALIVIPTSAELGAKIERKKPGKTKEPKKPSAKKRSTQKAAAKPRKVASPETAPSDAPPVAPAVPPVARTRAGDNIRAAIERLMRQEQDFPSLTRRSAAQRVREVIGASYEKGNGLSDPNLARHIRRKCGPRVRRTEQA